MPHTVKGNSPVLAGLASTYTYGHIERDGSMTLRTVAIAAVAFAAACGDSPTSPAVDGIYRLQRVNGAPLPGVLQASATDTTRATGGTLTISTDRTWRAEVVLAITSRDVTTPGVSTASGTFTQSGQTITLRMAKDGSVVNATVDGDRLLTAIDGVPLEFGRR
jgi:hypothetical protein